jgi:hypothetical protein
MAPKLQASIVPKSDQTDAGDLAPLDEPSRVAKTAQLEGLRHKAVFP